jgi:hypothetical protein
MALRRTTSLTLLTLAATLWAFVLAVGGLWLALEGPARWPLVAPIGARVSGAVLFFAGQFLFMYLVADRWFPKARRGLTWPLELAATLAMTAGLAWIVVTAAAMRAGAL